MLPITSGEITFPATRTMKSSPKFASKISSGGTRESAQPRMVAYGCCSLAKAARVSLQTVGKCASPVANRLLPSISLRTPCSADNTVFSVQRCRIDSSGMNSILLQQSQMQQVEYSQSPLCETVIPSRKFSERRLLDGMD